MSNTDSNNSNISNNNLNIGDGEEMAATQPFDIFSIEEEYDDAIGDVLENKKMNNSLPQPFLESSPFRPIIGERQKGRTTVLDNQYATIYIEGEELDIGDEDILLAVLSTKQFQAQTNTDIVEYNLQSNEYITSINEIINKAGVKKRGKKTSKNGVVAPSTSDEVIASLERLKKSTITMQRKKEKRTIMFEIFDFLDMPMTNINGEIQYAFESGNKKQVRVSLSRNFLFFYSDYKRFDMKLTQRMQIKTDLGKAIFRYLTYLTTFHKKGVHRIGFDKFCSAISWKPHTQIKNGKTYVRWKYNQTLLEKARDSLLAVDIYLILPSEKLSKGDDAIVEIRTKKYHENINGSKKD